MIESKVYKYQLNLTCEQQAKMAHIFQCGAHVWNKSAEAFNSSNNRSTSPKKVRQEDLDIIPEYLFLMEHMPQALRHVIDGCRKARARSMRWGRKYRQIEYKAPNAYNAPIKISYDDLPGPKIDLNGGLLYLPGFNGPVSIVVKKLPALPYKFKAVTLLQKGMGFFADVLVEHPIPEEEAARILEAVNNGKSIHS